jgi:hypothetical protein
MKPATQEPQPISLEAALAQSTGRVRHLLLGNGFSISARESFTYSSLFRRAGTFSPAVEALFRDNQTEDFEKVLDLLKPRRAGSSLPPIPEEERSEQEAEVRARFIDALQRVHPEHSMMMGREESVRCASFLERFVGRRRGHKLAGRVYTTNYDLLLYWTVAKSGRRLWCYDAHISPPQNKRYGEWDPEKVPSLVYLHGALHLYDMPRGRQGMLRYAGSLSLIDQARARLARGQFPVMVSEGTTEAKAERIARSEYLKSANRWSRTGMRNREAVLFTYGHGLDPRDAHILSEIGGGRIAAIYLGVWGGLEGDEASRVHQWAERWWEARRGRSPLAVYVYDTKTYSPWRSSPPVVP